MNFVHGTKPEGDYWQFSTAAIGKLLRSLTRSSICHYRLPCLLTTEIGIRYAPSQALPLLTAAAHLQVRLRCISRQDRSVEAQAARAARRRAPECQEHARTGHHEDVGGHQHAGARKGEQGRADARAALGCLSQFCLVDWTEPEDGNQFGNPKTR